MPPSAKKSPAGPMRRLATGRSPPLGDLDASAYQPRARRPGFETLITEAAARSADGVLVWKLDRLVRRPQGL
jgi:hypothetical protein